MENKNRNFHALVFCAAILFAALYHVSRHPAPGISDACRSAAYAAWNPIALDIDVGLATYTELVCGRRSQ